MPKLTSRKEILELFDKNVTAARKAITEAKDEDMGRMWSLVAGRPAASYHAAFGHRPGNGPQPPDPPPRHLCVYLRLNDIPVPGMYGPSGDE